MPRDGTVLSPYAQDMKPRGLLHALSEIEQLSVSEKKGSAIPEEAITTANLISFFTVGVKIAIINILITMVLSPVMFAARGGLIPVFGTYNPSGFDVVYIFLLTISFSTGVALFMFAILRKVYMEHTTKRVVGSFISGFVSGTIFGVFISILLVHIVYYSYLTPEGLSHLYWKIPEFIRPGYRTYWWFMRFGEALIPGVYFQGFVNFFSVLIVLSAYFMARMKTARIKRLNEIWS